MVNFPEQLESHKLNENDIKICSNMIGTGEYHGVFHLLSMNSSPTVNYVKNV